MRFIIHVSTVVTRNGQVLLVREADGRWNLPGGHLQPGEALVDGARREVREEVGLDVAFDAFVGVYTGRGVDHCLNVVFAGRATGDRVGGELHSEWFTLAAIAELPDRSILNPSKLRRVFDDWRRRPLPVDAVCEDMYG